MDRAPPILVVDDDDDLRDTLCQLLELAGYAARGAASGRTALEALRAGPVPRLILLDLMMPDMDGWQFRGAQRALPGAAADVPVIVITASRNLDKFPIDAAAVVLKPFAIDALMEKVREHCAP